MSPTLERALAVLLKAEQALSTDTIASRMGYRPARSGRLAVNRVLRLQLHEGKDVGVYVHRLVPLAEWGITKWAMHPEGAKLYKDQRPRAEN